MTLINIYVFKSANIAVLGFYLAPSGLLSWVKGMHGHKSLLTKPHLALGTHFINLKTQQSATVSL